MPVKHICIFFYTDCTEKQNIKIFKTHIKNFKTHLKNVCKYHQKHKNCDIHHKIDIKIATLDLDKMYNLLAFTHLFFFFRGRDTYRIK